MRRFISVQVHTADFEYQTDITLKDVPRFKYKLWLFIGNEERELQREDNRTWTPVQRQYVLRFVTVCTIQRLCVCRGVSLASQMRVEIQMKSGHLPWAKKEQTDKLIDIQKVFDDYWSSNMREVTVPGQT